MASIEKYTSKGVTRYRARWRDPDGSQRKRTFSKKGDAARFLATAEADVLRGQYIAPDAGRVTFKAYATSWLAAQVFDEGTRAQLEGRLRVHVYPTLGNKTLAQIKPSTIQAWARSLDGLAPSYVRDMMANVGAVLAAAVDDERIARNPARAHSVTRPRVTRRKVVPWTTERVLAVTDALPEPYRVAATLAAGLGLRQGEVFGLSPDDVHFLRGEVEVRRQVKLLRGRQVFALPKGGKTRTVPLPPSVRDVLAAHLAVAPAQAVTLPWKTLDGEPVTTSLVLTTRERTAFNRNYFNRRVWAPALEACDVPPGRDNGMHACRHFYASVLLDAGESIKAVSEYLGHSDPGFTLRTYTHLMPQSSERTRRAVDAVLSKSCALPVPSASAEGLR